MNAPVASAIIGSIIEGKMRGSGVMGTHREKQNILTILMTIFELIQVMLTFTRYFYDEKSFGIVNV